MRTYSKRHWLVLAVAALALAGCMRPKQREARYIGRAITELNAGHLIKAQIYFSNAARLMPADPAPPYYIGLIMEARGHELDAFKSFQSSNAQDPHFVPAALKLAQYFMAAEDLDQSAQFLKGVLQDHPENADAHALNGSVFLRRGDNASTVAEARTALRLEPGNLLAVAVLVGLDVRLHDEAAVDRELASARTLRPDNASLLQLAANAYAQLGDDSKLMAVQQDLLKLVPQARAVRFALADQLARTGHIEEGISLLRAGVAIAPDDDSYTQRLVAFADAHLGEAGAQAEISKLIKQAPANENYPFWQASLYWRHGDAARANALLWQINKPDHTQATQIRAKILLAQIAQAQGQKDLAASYVGGVLSIQWDNHEALYMRASQSVEEGKPQDAEIDLRYIIREAPGDAPAEQLLAELLLRQGHVDLAADTLTHLLDLDPTNLPALVRLAQFRHLLGDDAQARQLLSLVTKLSPLYPQAWETMARIAGEAGDYQAADAAVARLAALPDQARLATLLRAQNAARQGDVPQALAMLDGVVRGEPSTTLGQSAFGTLIDIERAHRAYEDGLARIATLPVDPVRKADAMGEFQLALHQDALAAASFDQVVAAGGPYAPAYIGRAAIYVRAGDDKAAIGVLEKGRHALPADLSIPLQLGGLLLERGDFDRAASVYYDILARDPGQDLAANNLASLVADHYYQDPKTLERARQLAERFRASDDVQYLDTIAWVYYREGSVTEALSIFGRIAQLGEMPAGVHYHYGAALLSAGNRPAARRELESATGVEDARRLLSTF